ncbi:MAG: hypothetical protein WA919_14715 [Coleofasciculaceae cyanobacterium]
MNSTLSLSPKRIFRVLTSIVLTLIILSLIGQFAKNILGHERLFGFVQLTDVNGERNIPAWFSSSLLIFSSVLLAVITVVKKSTGARYISHWLGLSLIFLCLSMDEAISLHERTIEPLRTGLKATGLFYSAWVLLGAGFVSLILLMYLKFIGHLPSKTRFLFILAGAMYVGGAIGVELLHGYYLELYGKDMAYALIATVEELLEMMGIVVFIYALFSYLQGMIELHVRIDNNKLTRELESHSHLT